MLEVYPQIEHMFEYEKLKFEIITLDKNGTTSKIYDDITIQKISDREYIICYDYSNEYDAYKEKCKLNKIPTYQQRHKVNIVGKDGKMRANIGSLCSIYNFRDSKGAVNLSWLQRMFVEGRKSNHEWDILRWYPSKKRNITQYLFDYTKLHTDLISIIDKLIVHSYNTLDQSQNNAV